MDGIGLDLKAKEGRKREEGGLGLCGRGVSHGGIIEREGELGHICSVTFSSYSGLVGWLGFHAWHL